MDTVKFKLVRDCVFRFRGYLMMKLNIKERHAAEEEMNKLERKENSHE